MNSRFLKPGDEFGRLRLIDSFRKDGREWWHCLCQCGRQKSILKYVLVGGRARSCNCLYNESRRRPMSDEAKRKIGNANRGKIHSLKFRLAISIRQTGRKQSEETKQRRADAHRGQKRSIETRQRISIGVSKAMRDPALRHKLSVAARRAWSNPIIATRQLAAIWESLQARPNKAELQLDSILQSMYPREYKFVGDGSFLIDGLNPDFININGQKTIIELFGERFHLPAPNRSIPFRRTAQGRKEVFAHFGYKTLILWWKELQNESQVIIKIRQFHEENSFAAGER